MDRGLHPVVVEEKSANGKAAAARGGGEESAAVREGRVSQKSVESFTRELANLLSGGVPLARALQLLRREASSPAAKYVWGKIHDDVVSGNPLAESMAKWPKAFSSVYVAMVRAGEAGGFLDVVLGLGLTLLTVNLVLFAHGRPRPAAAAGAVGPEAGGEPAAGALPGTVTLSDAKLKTAGLATEARILRSRAASR